MNTDTIVRAWKDPGFRASLSAAQRAAIPECPSGSSIAELSSAERDEALGGRAFLALRHTIHQNPDCSFILTGCLHTQCNC